MRKKLAVTLFFCAYLANVLAQSKTISGFTSEAATQQIIWEEKFDKSMNTANIDKLIKDMAARPHHVGSPGDKAVAEYIQQFFQNLGYDSKIEVLYSLSSNLSFGVLKREYNTSIFES